MEVAEYKGPTDGRPSGTVMAKEEMSVTEESKSRKVRDEGDKHIEEAKDSVSTAESMRSVEQSVKQTTEGNVIRKVSSTKVSSSSSTSTSSQKEGRVEGLSCERKFGRVQNDEKEIKQEDIKTTLKEIITEIEEHVGVNGNGNGNGTNGTYGTAPINGPTNQSSHNPQSAPQSRISDENHYNSTYTEPTKRLLSQLEEIKFKPRPKSLPSDANLFHLWQSLQIASELKHVLRESENQCHQKANQVSQFNIEYKHKMDVGENGDNGASGRAQLTAKPLFLKRIRSMRGFFGIYCVHLYSHCILFPFFITIIYTQILARFTLK